MCKNYHVLLIDDRPMMLYGLKAVFTTNNSKQFEVDFTTSYHHAWSSIIDNKGRMLQYDLVIVDVDILTDTNVVQKSYEYYLRQIKERQPNCKFIATLRKMNNYKIHRILKSIKPAAFLLENELNMDLLFEVLMKIERNEDFYSKSIMAVIYNEGFWYEGIDEIDREILYFLKKGIKTNSLPKYIARSLSSIEKRKQRMKEVLVIDNCSDEKLIVEASRLGII